MAYNSNIAYFMPLITFNTTGLTSSYKATGTPFPYPVRIMNIINGSNVGVTFSFDGVTDHAFLPASDNQIKTFVFGEVRGTSSNALELPAGTQVWVKGSSGTGSVYITSVAAINPTMQIPL